MAKRKQPKSLAGWGLLVFVAFLAFLRYPGLILIIFGLVVLYYFYRWKLKSLRYKKTLQSGIREIDVMQGVEFENYLEVLFSGMGYKVETTPATGDFGADLILKKDGQTIAVQAKRYSKTVGVEAVQQVIGSMSYYAASGAWVVTNNTFSSSAYELAEKSNVTLIDRKKLINLINKNSR